MKPEDFLKDAQSKIGDLLRQSPAKDVERNVRAMLAQGFSKLDIVTREDFDTQAQVLARTRQRLEELERRVARLEQRGNEPATAPVTPVTPVAPVAPVAPAATAASAAAPTAAVPPGPGFPPVTPSSAPLAD